MTFDDLKTKVKRWLKGDTADVFPDSEDVLKDDIANGYNYLLTLTIPLSLVTTDDQYTILKRLNDEYFIKQPSSITSDSSVIEIDSELEQYLIYYVAYLNTSKEQINFKIELLTKAQDIINQYNKNNQKDILEYYYKKDKHEEINPYI
jgi:hypothetical protein